MRLIDADKLILSLNDNYLANSPTGNETLAVQDCRKSVCEGLEIAMATVEDAPTVCGWISVEDRLPENEKVVICYTPCDGYMFVGFYRTSKSKSYDWSSWQIITAMRSTRTITKKVTHWMSLPEPPEEVNDERTQG